MFDLNREITHLLRSEPFFARVSLRLDKIANEKIPTAGVIYNKDRRRFEMVYNPKFMEGLSERQRQWVLKHEFYHIALGHTTTRSLKDIVGGNMKLANIAMDLAINSLDDMRRDCLDFALYPGRAPYQNISRLGMSAEWYANKLLDENEGGPGEGQPGEGQPGGGQPGAGDDNPGHDHHGFNGEGLTDEEIEEMEFAAGKLQDAVNKAIQECDNGDEQGGPAGWGSVSSRMRARIIKANSRTLELDPQQVWNSFCKASQVADKKVSITRRSRRLPGKKFGRRVNRRAHIYVSVDQSGSVSDQLLQKAYEFMEGAAKFATFTVVPFDHQVFEEKIFVWKRGEKRRRERVLYGGTDFNAPTRYVNGQADADGHIVITDMCAPAPIRSNCQRMWLTDSSGQRYNRAAMVSKNERVMVL